MVCGGMVLLMGKFCVMSGTRVMVCVVCRAHYLWNLSVLLHRFSLFTRSRRMRRGSALERPPVDKEGAELRGWWEFGWWVGAEWEGVGLSRRVWGLILEFGGLNGMVGGDGVREGEWGAVGS